ncbi:MAG: hypothetical protein DHS20C08_08990 [Rhodomicrobium sp.]|nr:MAG: hypothetical protein DHS20C08_08990 [Rhodomicrobium sp.]
MLLRFLGIATISVTFLTVQAMSSMESSIAHTPDRAAYESEVVYTNATAYRTALTSDYMGRGIRTIEQRQRELVKRAHSLTNKRLASNNAPPLPVRLRSNIDDPSAEFGKLLKRKITTTKIKKQFIRHAYLPKSHDLNQERRLLLNPELRNTEIASDAVDSDSNTITSNIETAKLETSSLTYDNRKSKSLKAVKRYQAPKAKKQRAVIKSYKKKKSVKVKKRYKNKMAKRVKRKSRYKKTNYLAAFN